MCGINGFNFENEKIIKEMNERVHHRGPDSRGFFCSDKVSLGHSRLKIIDLSEKAKQPMFDSENKIGIVFNGELYNYQEIKSELEEKGHKFNSESDTEVIINSYIEWGTNCVNHFNGMWAFAIYDRERNILFLSRDRMGKKPLHYYNQNRKFIFASEIKSLFMHEINKELNPKSISSFLSYRYVLGKDTMFQGISKLLPAHNLIYNLKEKKIEKVWEYWDLEIKENDDDEGKAIEKTKKLLQDSIRLRKISDVPVGSLNSGGLDSSLVSGIMAKMQKDPIRTFTIKFSENKFDETPYARILSNYCKTIHKEVKVEVEDFLHLMKEYTKQKDEPIGVPNEIPLSILFKKIKEDVTVVLSGEGADEISAGYGRVFRSPFDYERIKDLGDEEYREKYPSLYKKYNGRNFKDELDHYMYVYNYFPEEEKNSILLKEYQADFRPMFESYFNKFDTGYDRRISYVFIKLHLPGLLARLDNSSMLHGVEARCPFLDHRLVEYIFNLPSTLKNPWIDEKHKKNAEKKNSEEIAENDDIPKYIIKKAAAAIIPDEIINRKKQGFPLPFEVWFSGEFLEESKKLILSEDSKIKKVVNQEKLKEWINKGAKGDERRFWRKFWMLVSLELWLREWF